MAATTAVGATSHRQQIDTPDLDEQRPHKASWAFDAVRLTRG